MSVTISDKEVNELRQKTGSGMMDCKKALEESNGDFEKAVEILRKKGQKVAANRADRESSEGVVLAKVSEDNTYGIIISLNCETDFVAKNEDFINFVKELSELNNQKNSNLDELKNAKMNNGQTVNENLVASVSYTHLTLPTNREV